MLSWALVLWTYGGYESKEIRIRNEIFLLVNLRMSLVFSFDLSMAQLQSILTNIQMAFQNEEVRVAALKLQKINATKSAEIINYYSRALLSLAPLFFARNSLVAFGIKPSASCTIHDLATTSANVFNHRDLEEDFKKKSLKKCDQSLIMLWVQKCFM